MYALNEVKLIGNVGQNPEIKKPNSELTIANFSIATTEKWKNKAGEKVEKTEWHKVTAFGALAGIIEKYVKKGCTVYVSGKLKYSKKEEEGKETKYYTEIIISDLIIIKSPVAETSKVKEFDDTKSLKEQSEALKKDKAETEDTPF